MVCLQVLPAGSLVAVGGRAYHAMLRMVMVGQTVGQVMGIAIRAARRGPMSELDEALLAAEGGIEGDLHTSPDRGITLLSSQQWEEVT